MTNNRSITVNIGGIICNGNRANIKNCYNLGNIIVNIEGYDNSNYNATGVSGKIGGIVGSMESGGSISYCYNNGLISFTGKYTKNSTSKYGGMMSYVGGIVGYHTASSNTNTDYFKNNYNTGNILSDCYLDASVVYSTPETNAGGLVGKISNMDIVKSYNTGNVTSNMYINSAKGNSKSYAGGIVGNTGRGLTDCYNTGDVVSNNSSTVTKSSSSYKDEVYAGGLSGTITYFAVNNTYNTGDVKAISGKNTNEYVGPIVGSATRYEGGNNYYLDEIELEGATNNNSGTPKTDYELRTDEFYNTLNVNEVWLHKNKQYPVLAKGISSELVESTEITIENTLATYDILVFKEGSGSVKIGDDLEEHTVNPIEEINYNGSNTKQIKFVPDSEYEIASISINNEEIGFKAASDGSFTMPAGYFQNIKEDKVIRVKFANKVIEIEKVDTDNKVLPGAKFKVSKGNIEYNVTTNSNGIAIIGLQENGTYNIQEIEAPEHHILNSEVKTVEITDTSSKQTLTFVNERKATVTVHHIWKDSNNVDHKVAEDDIYEGEPDEKYLALPHVDIEGITLKKDENGDYIIPENTYGTFGTESKEITYYYDADGIKLEIHHYEENTENDIVAPVTEKIDAVLKEDEDGYYTNVVAEGTYEIGNNEDYIELSRSLDPSDITFKEENVSNIKFVDPDSTVTYSNNSVLIYNYITPTNQGIVRVRHLIAGTEEQVPMKGEGVVGDDILTGYVGEYYSTSESSDKSELYELENIVGNKNGKFINGTIEVIYYYHLIDADIKQVYTKEAPEEITEEGAVINYTLNYTATIDDFKGKATITLVDELPFKIDITKCTGITRDQYDEETKTITWIQEVENIDTEVDGPKVIPITKTFGVVYDDESMSPVETIINNATGKIKLDTTNQEEEIKTTGGGTVQNYKRKISVIKRWTDNDTQKLRRPDSVKINVYRENVQEPVKTYEHNSSSGFTYEFTGLPKYTDSGELINYTVDEVSDLGRFYENEITGNMTDGYIINNKFKKPDDKVTVNVSVVWNDDNNQYEVRPDSVDLHVNDEVETVNEASLWKHTFLMDKYNDNGEEITTFNIDETGDLAVYKKEIDTSRSGDVVTSVITNTMQPAKITHTLDKISPREVTEEGSAIEYTIKHENIKIENYKGDAVITLTDYLPYKINTSKSTYDADAQYNVDENGQATLTWTIQVDDIDTEANGGVVEIPSIIKTFSVVYDDERLSPVDTIVNTVKAKIKLVTTNQEDEIEKQGGGTKQNYKTQVEVKKEWKNENATRKQRRPTSIEIQVVDKSAPSIVVDSERFDITPESDDFTYTFTDLPKYNSQGEKIEYEVKEGECGEFYTSEAVETAEGKYTVSNTFGVPEDKISISGRVVWNDNNDQENVRPESVIVVATGKGNYKVEKVVTPGTNNNWEYEIQVNKYTEDGEEHEFVLSEIPSTGVKGANLRYYTIDINQSTHVITNTFEPEQTTVTVNKSWVGDEQFLDKRPDSIIVELFADGISTGRQLVVKASDGWTGTFTNLKKKNYETDTDIVYTVAEVGAGQGNLEFYSETPEIIGFNITNTFRIPDKTCNIEVRKRWSRDENALDKRPDSITVILKADGVEKERVNITAADGWAYTFENLRELNETTAQPIVYTVDEVDVTGYTKEISGYLITNTYENIDVELKTVIKKDGTSLITKKDQPLTYTIKYNSTLDNYEGDAKIEIIDELPYKIDVSKSNLEGGVYDEEAKTITWTEEIKDINTFEKGKLDIVYVKELTVVYKDLDVTKTEFYNKSRGKIYLDDKDVIEVEGESNRTKVALKFNLEVQKEIKRILLNNEDIEISDPSLAKVTVDRKNVEGTVIGVEYAITVKNTESIDGSATVVEELPEDIRFIEEESDPRWELGEDRVLRAKTGIISAGEEENFKVVLVWVGGENSFGVKTNTAKIEEVKGESGFKEDDDDDNTSKAELVIEISTGDKRIVLLVLGTIILIGEIAGFMYISKKRKNA